MSTGEVSSYETQSHSRAVLSTLDPSPAPTVVCFDHKITAHVHGACEYPSFPSSFTVIRLISSAIHRSLVVVTSVMLSRIVLWTATPA